MPELTNPRYELVAVGLAQGMSATAAYASAGYKPNRGHASRLVANGSIRARVAEIQSSQLKRSIEYAAVNVREQMHKLMGIVDAALEAKDLKTASTVQMFIMEMFGYKDMPTMTHDHLGERANPLAPTEPARPSGGNVVELNANILRGGRVHQEMEKFTAARAAEQAAKRKEALQD